MLDLEQTASRYVIDALLTNQHDRHTVKITRTLGFYSQKEAPVVSGASVQVSDNTGRIIRYIETAPGVYQSETAFAGEIGKTYTLNVKAGGQEFTASEPLLPLTPIEKLEWRINEREQRNPSKEGRFYDILFFATEPQDRVDFYYFKFFRNGLPENGDGSFFAIGDDTFIAEKIDGLPFGVYYAEGDTARVEMYSISRRMYVYFSDMNNVLSNDGGMFSPIPANPRTNISNGALGLFQVSAVEKAEIVTGR
jgi:hypothetical protein